MILKILVLEDRDVPPLFIDSQKRASVPSYDVTKDFTECHWNWKRIKFLFDNFLQPTRKNPTTTPFGRRGLKYHFMHGSFFINKFNDNFPNVIMFI